MYRPDDVAVIQRRTLRVLGGTQIIGGVGVAIGISVGALLAADLAGTRLSGLAGSAAVIGAAAFAIPATRIMNQRGRRPALAFAYLVGMLGAAAIAVGVTMHSVAFFFTGMFLFGAGSTANLQARYTAVDLAAPGRRGRQLSLVVWATTVGAVAGPSLAPATDRLALGWGLPEYTGAFLLSVLAFATAAVAILIRLRPDPLLVARSLLPAPAALPVSDEGATAAPAVRGLAWREAIAAVRESRAAALGLGAVVVGHLVMVGVMSMTPVHISAYTSGHTHVLRVVGVVLSVHIAGMYALAPVVGWLTDRVGRRPVIVGSVAALLSACAVAGTAGEHTARLAVGLALLGLGWSGTMVAGSTLLSESVAAGVRPAVQGLSDVVMGIAAASAGAVAGVVVDFFGYPALALVAAISAVPLLGAALRRTG